MRNDAVILECVLGLNIRNELVITDYLGYYCGTYSMDLRKLPYSYRMKLLTDEHTLDSVMIKIQETPPPNTNIQETPQPNTLLNSFYRKIYDLFYYSSKTSVGNTSVGTKRFWVSDVL